jgi:hypothetical protein
VFAQLGSGDLDERVIHHDCFKSHFATRTTRKQNKIKQLAASASQEIVA